MEMCQPIEAGRSLELYACQLQLMWRSGRVEEAGGDIPGAGKVVTGIDRRRAGDETGTQYSDISGPKAYVS